MAIVEVNENDFRGSVLTGSGSDTLKLLGGGSFDFESATVSGFSTIDMGDASVNISGQNLVGVDTITGLSSAKVNLTGSQIDLSGKTFSDPIRINIADDNATVTVSSLSLGLSLTALRKQGETIVLNGPVSTPAARSELFAQGFDKIIEGQNQWMDAAPVITGFGGNHIHVQKDEAVLLDPDGDAVFSDAEGTIASLVIELSDTDSSAMQQLKMGKNFTLVDQIYNSDLFYQGVKIGNIFEPYSDSATIRFYTTATPDIVNEFVRSLAYEPGNFVYEDDISITFTARDAGFRKAQAIVYIDAESNPAPTEPTLTGRTIAENSAAGTVVGVLKATDASGDPVNYRLLDDAGGRFSIQGDKLVVSGKAPIDYEAAKDHTVKVIANDGERDGQPGTFVISVIDVADTSTPASPAVGQTRIGTSRTDRLSGTGGNDILKGRAGNDVLKGLAGDDQLWGEAGKDVLYGGAGKDIFVFNTKLNKKTNLDKIADFNVKDDTIWLDNRYMPKLGKGTALKPGKLNKKFFTIGNKAKDKNDYLVYDKKKGVLYYDSDGSGSHKAVEIATLKKNLKLTYHDFMVI